jgi:hypothetical protein
MAFTPGSISNKYQNTGSTNTSGFVPGSISSKVISTTKGTGGFSSGSIAAKYAKPKADLSTLEGLKNKATELGYETDIEKISPEPKLSFLQRLSKGLGTLNPAEAILTGKEEGVGRGILEYGKNIATGIGSAITGKDYEEGRRMFKDVVEEMGVENKIAQFGIGFVGDVLLDPSTYFGGAIAKGLVKGTAKAANIGLKGIGKVAPATEEGLRLAATGLQDAAGRALQYGYKATKGAKDDVVAFLTKSQKAKLGLASSNLSRLGTNTLTKSQQEELALKLIAGKRAEFTAREVGKSADEIATIVQETAKSSDPLVQKVISEQSARSKSFAAGIGVENPYETYFPFIKKDKVEKFLKESQGIKVGSEGYKKQFKNLLTNENMELNPASAFFTRESQIVGDKMTADFLEGFVKKYGKPLTEFDTTDDAIKAGYQLIKDKGMFGKELGFVNKYDANLIRNSLDSSYPTIDMIAKATGFDAVTSLFKRSVTGLFAPFHVRNYMSGMIQNYETIGSAALNPKSIMAGQKIALIVGKGGKFPSGTIKIGGKTQKLDKILKPFADRFSGDTFYNNDFLNAINKNTELKQVQGVFSKGALKETAKTLGLGQESTPFKAARAIGQFIEHQQKATVYVASLSQGKTVRQALDLAEKAGFDYRALTKFESQILRRIIPFYSFTRKNIELQLKTLGENPQRINNVLNFFENIGEPISAEEKKNLPAYIREAIGVKLEDTPEGLKQYISSFGTPIEAFTNLFESNPILKVISMMNPLLKAPIEIGIGKDSFRQKDLKDVYNANEYKLAPQVLKDLLDITEVQKDILKKNAQGKLVKVGERTEYQADPVKLLIARSLFTSRGVSYLDQVFGGDLKGFVKLMKTTTGFKPQQVNLETNIAVEDKRQKRELEDLLIKRGDVRLYQSVYEPKQ